MPQHPCKQMTINDSDPITKNITLYEYLVVIYIYEVFLWMATVSNFIFFNLLLGEICRHKLLFFALLFTSTCPVLQLWNVAHIVSEKQKKISHVPMSRWTWFFFNQPEILVVGAAHMQSAEFTHFFFIFNQLLYILRSSLLLT